MSDLPGVDFKGMALWAVVPVFVIALIVIWLLLTPAPDALLDLQSEYDELDIEYCVSDCIYMKVAVLTEGGQNDECFDYDGYFQFHDECFKECQ